MRCIRRSNARHETPDAVHSAAERTLRDPLRGWLSEPAVSSILRGVGRGADVPKELARGLFTVGEAAAAGVSRRQLQGSAYRRVAQGVYRAAALRESPDMILRSTLRTLPPGAVFSGATAAWLLGLDLTPCKPVEVTVSEASWLRPRANLSVVRTELKRNEIVIRRGLATTSPLRTLTDLGRRAALVDAVVALDEAVHKRLLDLGAIHRFAATRPGSKGIARLRRALQLVEPASESPMESRLRLCLVLAGLPKPAAQVTIYDRGQFVARPDLLYSAERLALEYDGGTHRGSLVDDNRRQNRLVRAGYRVLRFTAGDLQRNSEGVVAQVSAELSRKLPHPTEHSDAE